ncbi:MarR family winged helix-turn-helix transcriptional regulator [Streptomyces sp. NPDC051921]|uniref:MarR family winged helix-turn-helix transcriptional regulator n=1 Tax=Streptomyces sp. NPDC051921 TaxID=3155806 RepID=UPI0034485AFE
MEDVRTQRPFGYWLKHIDGAIEGGMARLFAADGLSRRGWQVLNTVAYEPVAPSRLDEVMGAFLSADEPSMRAYVDDLVRRGWAEQAADGTVALTEEGRTAHRRISEQVGALRTRITECLSPEEFGTLTALLRRVGEHVDALAAEAARDRTKGGPPQQS